MMAAERVKCKPQTRDEVEKEVRRILKKYEGVSACFITREKIMEEMGVTLPPRYKHDVTDRAYIWLRQAISRTMSVICLEDPHWEKTSFVQSPSWRWKP